MIHLRLCLLFLPLLLGACSTAKEEKKTPPLMSQKMSDRMNASRKRMGDPNDRSVFDKSMRSSITKGKSSGWMGKNNFKAGSYTGTNAYTNTKKFKAGSFSGADNKNGLGNKTFAQSGKASSAASESFKTGENRMAGQNAREGSQTFSDAGDVFKTRSNRDALRSQIKNDRPHFIELEENQRTPAYSEEQVRRLLGRD